ncbi:MAG: 30S ribosomal protein S12 methylthiotransferase RimO [Anaerolineales bacterium]|nr:30S ribosomal protein S12 methylthiotransferase RimO [Anaerolineales bacterium]
MAKVKSKRFHLVSLGCSKNTVDSEGMAQLLGGAGFAATADPRQAEVLIVNTCGFIGPAKKESVDVLNELAAHKKRGQLLIAAGCLTQRYGAEVARQVPGLDGILGTRRWMDIVDLVQRLRAQPHPAPVYHLPDEAAVVGPDPLTGAGAPATLRAAVQGRSAYLKIADGCRRPCAFCAIPVIKGTAVSRPLPLILDEARRLEALGVRELILIAQDTTDYGHDLGVKEGLSELLAALPAAAPRIDWFRVMYAFPGYVTDRQIETMAAHPQILHYLDMPLQHGHPATLRRMRRPANVDWVHRTIGKMRAAMPDLAIRSTFIVGYPGETEEEFQALLDFVAELRLDRLGVFTFSFEPGTESAALGDPVPEEVKAERRDRLMALQQPISLAKNQALIGRTLPVLVEGRGDGLSVGRSYRDAPEIDGLVIIDGDVPVGEMAPVRISGALAYDLSGTVDTAPAQVVGLPLELTSR